MQLLVLETTQTSSTLFIFKVLITTPEFPEPPSYCPIPCGLFPLCSVDIGRSFGGVVPKFELVQHKIYATGRGRSGRSRLSLERRRGCRPSSDRSVTTSATSTPSAALAGSEERWTNTDRNLPSPTKYYAIK
ncbi:hypothetical protein FHG87_013901 [Trinorchestia longiramus]|nr:hypothetical protein FHG87_013901 [Trinorchestia longiramus]